MRLNTNLIQHRELTCLPTKKERCRLPCRALLLVCFNRHVSAILEVNTSNESVFTHKIRVDTHEIHVFTHKYVFAHTMHVFNHKIPVFANTNAYS